MFLVCSYVEKKIYKNKKIETHAILKMPNANWKILGDVSMLAAIGLGVMSINRFSQTNIHTFDEYKFIARDRALIHILSRFQALKQQDAFYDLAEKINTFLELTTLTTDSGFTANRLANEINIDAKNICTLAKSSKDVDILNTVVDVEDELLPALDTICQNTLRNMLLRRI